MEKINLELTIIEANTILAGLVQQPYIKVAGLVQKIQEQGALRLNIHRVDHLKEKEIEHTTYTNNGK